MKKILLNTALLCLLSSPVMAQVPNVLVNGDVIDAAVLNQNFDSLTAADATQQANVTAAESNITANGTAIGVNASDITAILSSAAAIQTQLTAVEASNTAQGTTITTLQTNLGAAQTNISTLTTANSDLLNTVTTQSSTITAQGSTITTLQTELALAQAELASLQTGKTWLNAGVAFGESIGETFKYGSLGYLIKSPLGYYAEYAYRTDIATPTFGISNEGAIGLFFYTTVDCTGPVYSHYGGPGIVRIHEGAVYYTPSAATLTPAIPASFLMSGTCYLGGGGTGTVVAWPILPFDPLVVDLPLEVLVSDLTRQ